jgi:hypothetical protein
MMDSGTSQKKNQKIEKAFAFPTTNKKIIITMSQQIRRHSASPFIRICRLLDFQEKSCYFN